MDADLSDCEQIPSRCARLHVLYGLVCSFRRCAASNTSSSYCDSRSSPQTSPRPLLSWVSTCKSRPLRSPLPSSLTLSIHSGTGASAIYPLLAVRTAESASSSSTSTFPPLKMLATDINDHSLDFAKRNVAAKDLTEAIQLFKVDEEGAIFPEEVVNSVERCVFRHSPSGLH